MTLEEAIKIITTAWEELRGKQTPKEIGYSHPKSDAVWCASSNIADSYEVDEEWIGISPQGNIVWAYASGCSCWDGDYTEEKKPTMKEVTLAHKHSKEEWEKAIIAFAETQVLQVLPRYNRYE